MLLKGIEEAAEAPRPLAAADMVLVRIAHAADLPTPDEALRRLASGEPMPASAPAASGAPSVPASAPTATAPAPAARAAPSASPPPHGGARVVARGGGGGDLRIAVPEAAAAQQPANGRELRSFADIIALADAEREMALKIALERNVRLIQFDGAAARMEIAVTEEASTSLAGDLGKKLLQWTGRRWVIALGKGEAAPTVHEQRQAARSRLVDDAKTDPLVAAVLLEFPGAEIVDVRLQAGTAPLTIETPLEPAEDGEPPVDD